MNKPSPKQLKFVESYLKGGNATQAVIDAGFNVKDRAVAKTRGSQLMANQKVWALIESAGENAQNNMIKLANGAKNESVRLNANKDILDRGGFAPVQRIQNTTVNISIDNEKFDDIMGMYQARKQKKTSESL